MTCAGLLGCPRRDKEIRAVRNPRPSSAYSNLANSSCCKPVLTMTHDFHDIAMAVPVTQAELKIMVVYSNQQKCAHGLLLSDPA